MKDDDDLLPKKTRAKAAPARSSKKSSSSAQMVRIMRITRGVGIFLGGFVTLVGVMSAVGLATDNFWARFLVALVVVVGLPAFVADRLLKRAESAGGLGLVADIFAIVLLSFALILVAADVASRPLLVREGDRYARSGSRTMARLVYYLGGVSPVFPGEPDPTPAGSGSASASASASASGSASARPEGSK
jgi:hypothetical protein